MPLVKCIVLEIIPIRGRRELDGSSGEGVLKACCGTVRLGTRVPMSKPQSGLCLLLKVGD